MPRMPASAAPDATVRARSASVNRRPHPDLAALKERAFALTCTGLRSPAIALQLGVPERTIRRWINGTLLSLAEDALDPDCGPDDSKASGKPNDPDAAPANGSEPAAADTASSDNRFTPIPLERHRALAIERQLAVAVTAHAAYDRLMARHDDLLDSLCTLLRDNAATTACSPALAPLPPAVAHLTRLIGLLEAGATRHLHIAQAAHRDAARFQGVAAYAQTDARLTAADGHAEANAGAEDDAEPGDHLIPIEWVNPNDPNKKGLVPHHTFDANAALDDLINAPHPSMAFPRKHPTLTTTTTTTRRAKTLSWQMSSPSKLPSHLLPHHRPPFRPQILPPCPFPPRERGRGVGLNHRPLHRPLSSMSAPVPTRPIS